MGKTVKIEIAGMNCNHCAQTIEKGLKALPGVEKAKVDFKQKQGLLEVGNSGPNLENQIRTLIIELGYEVRGIVL